MKPPLNASAFLLHPFCAKMSQPRSGLALFVITIFSNSYVQFLNKSRLKQRMFGYIYNNYSLLSVRSIGYTEQPLGVNFIPTV